MVCVFLAFVLSGDSGAAMAGVGLAAAVALDAFILRTALVPAAMHLLGNSNWWLPAWLEKRLPHLAVEPKEEAEAPGTPDTQGPASAVHGLVRTADGEPVAGAAITLLSTGGRLLDRVVSLADGSYIVSVPAPGTYLLTATASPYGSRARRVVVTNGPLVHDVELAEGEVDAVN
jgi:RND superfamily putative drug exporter